MSAPTLPAPRRPFPSTPAPAAAPEAAGDGLGIADLVGLLGLDLDRLLLDTAEEDAAAAAAAAREPVDPVAVVRGWVRRAADWGSGPQRSWCAW